MTSGRLVPIAKEKRGKKEALRNLVFLFNLTIQKRLINATELRKISDDADLEYIDTIFLSLSKKLYAKSYLYVAIHEYIKSLTKAIHSIKNNNHLIHYKGIYEEMIYGRKRDEAKAY